MRRTVDAALQRRWAEALGLCECEISIDGCSEDGMHFLGQVNGGMPGKCKSDLSRDSKPETSTNPLTLDMADLCV